MTRLRKDIPIIYSAPMVRALIREATEPGTGKTMTRRLLYGLRKNSTMPRGPSVLQGYEPIITYAPGTVFPPTNFGPDESFTLTGWHQVQVGDRLWVRENAQLRSVGPEKGQLSLRYDADNDVGPEYVLKEGERSPFKATKLTPCIHMPRWASRLTLIVTSTKIERLNDISEADARAEGMPVDHNGNHYDPPPPEVDTWQGYGRASFSLLWSKLHGAGSWEENPWVVAIGFRVIMANIDAKESACPAP